MRPIETPENNRSHRRLTAALATTAILVAVIVTGAPDGARAEDEFPKVVTGMAILEHPAGKAIVEAAKLVKAGKLAEVKKKSVKEVREEWAAMPAAEQREEIARNRERAPDPREFEADIPRVGVLTIYGESATLRIPAPDGEVAAMAFVSLEGGHWKVTGGPMAFAPPPVETAPPIAGAAILDHPLGALAIEYAKRLEGGRLDAALELLSGPARAKRAAVPAAERKKSDDFRRRQLPPAATFAEQIRSGGQLSFVGDSAYLNVVTNVTTKNPDGSTSYTSTTTALAFELEGGEWKMGD